MEKKMNNLITVGLDLSLTSTGFTQLRNDKDIEPYSFTIKSKPDGKSPIDETKRLIDITKRIDKAMEVKPDLVVIENLAFMARNTTALTQLAGLSHFVRRMLYENGIPFIMVAPTSLKKFITGKGKVEKNLIMMTIFKDYNFEALDDNQADAFGLAACGLALLGDPLKDLTKPQNEVIELLKKQL